MGSVPRTCKPVATSIRSAEGGITNLLDVTIYNLAGEVVSTFHSDDEESVDYVSLVSPETYGPPALVAPTRGGTGPRAGVGDRILYINTSLVPFFDIERVSE